MSLPQKVWVGALLGILSGILFGQYCSYLKPFGEIYILTLELAAYPYVIAIVITSIGRLKSSFALRLLSKAWWVFLLIVISSGLVLFLVSLAIPAHISELPVGSSLENETAWLSLFIPNNLFEALSKNHVPAVIIFCVIFGIILQPLKDKSKLLVLLDLVATVCLNFWKWLVQYSPYAIFFLLASTIGTIELNKFIELGEFIFLYCLAASVLILWVFPALITTLTPLRYRQVFQLSGKALIIAAATTLSVAALPLLAKNIRAWLGPFQDAAQEEERKEVIDTLLFVSYPFVQIGNFFIYPFAIFSAYYLNEAIYSVKYSLLPIVSYFASIGSPSSISNSLQFLTHWLPLEHPPQDLYFSIMPILRYPQVLVSVMAIFTISIIVTCLYYEKRHVRWHRLIGHGLLVALFVSGTALIGKGLMPLPQYKMYEKYMNFEIDAPLRKKIKVTYKKKTQTRSIKNKKGSHDLLQEIQQRGKLIVGYNPNMRPFSYFNKKHELVGFDVTLMYALAQSLNVSIEFVPYRFTDLTNAIKAGAFDIAIGGIYVSKTRLIDVNFSIPYYQSSAALIVKSHAQSKFLNVEKIRQLKSLRIASFNDPVLIPLLKNTFPNADIIKVNQYDASVFQAFREGKFDAVVWSAIQAEIWSYGYPGYTAIVPENFNHTFLFALMLPKEHVMFLNYINYWMQIQNDSGFLNHARMHWIYGHPDTFEKPRWNIIDWVKNLFIHRHEKTSS